ncbi:MAG TPA: glycosyl transferase family 4 [Candidatus Nanoarchaeia archaeon]|nr:glycosyl transferase family 4 [Candidatus Nanoarchaeia archaeon]
MSIPDYSLAFILSFAFVLSALPYWISRAKQHGLLITDVQKLPERKIPYLAGLVVVFGAIVGILFFVASQTFLFENGEYNVFLLASVASILIALIIGVVDDLLGEKIGLRQYQKPLLTVFAALPIVVVNAGQNVMALPFIGQVTLGNFYSFVVVPLAIIGAANGFNMLAGVNGLEAGMGLIILSTLSYLSWATGKISAYVVALCVIAAILPFLRYNWCPARVLPGNSFTYAVGASIAIVAILGDLERSAIILFIPYFFELLLKLRGKFQKESLAKPLADGSLRNKYAKWYSLNHVAISFLRRVKGRAREWEVAALLLCLELAFAAATLAVYWK